LKYEGQAPTSVIPDAGTDTGVWRYETYRIPLTDVIENFTWEIGKGIDASGSPVDITGISLELFYR